MGWWRLEYEVSEERDFTFVFPEVDASLHSEVRAEVEAARAKGRPWTLIREVRKGVDNLSGLSCEGSQGEFRKDGACPNKVEGIQYNIYGIPLVFCEEHALKQNDWDKIFYDSKPKETPPLTKEQEESIRKLLEKPKKRKKKDEVEEVDPTA